MPCTARPQRTAPPSRRLWETRMHRKPLYSAQPFAELQCAVCLWSCSEGTDAAKVSRNFHWFQRTPRSQRARGAAGRRSQLSDGVSGSCLSHASERGPSASTDANLDRPTRRAGPAVCPGPASLSARELPCSRTEPPACPSRGGGGARGETDSQPSRAEDTPQPTLRPYADRFPLITHCSFPITARAGGAPPGINTAVSSPSKSRRPGFLSKPFRNLQRLLNFIVSVFQTELDSKQ